MSAVDIFIVTYAEELPQLGICLRSLRAHLQKLQAEGRATRQGDSWQAAA